MEKTFEKFNYLLNTSKYTVMYSLTGCLAFNFFRNYKVVYLIGSLIHEIKQFRNMYLHVLVFLAIASPPPHILNSVCHHIVHLADFLLGCCSNAYYKGQKFDVLTHRSANSTPNYVKFTLRCAT
jgi:hypothetical protein